MSRAGWRLAATTSRGVKGWHKVAKGGRGWQKGARRWVADGGRRGHDGGWQTVAEGGTTMIGRTAPGPSVDSRHCHVALSLACNIDLQDRRKAHDSSPCQILDTRLHDCDSDCDSTTP
jgi:hypothetical protein